MILCTRARTDVRAHSGIHSHLLTYNPPPPPPPSPSPLDFSFFLGGHRFPVKSVQWRYEDDYFLVECIDGSVYVWQLGTGHLDRVAGGKLAEDILASWVSRDSFPLPLSVFSLSLP